MVRQLFAFMGRVFGIACRGISQLQRQCVVLKKKTTHCFFSASTSYRTYLIILILFFIYFLLYVLCFYIFTSILHLFINYFKVFFSFYHFSSSDFHRIGTLHTRGAKSLFLFLLTNAKCVCICVCVCVGGF